jgi:hypothetical protein
VYEIETLFERRDSHFSQIVERRLADVNNYTLKAKNKIRHVWDLIIQGNIAEMEGAISEAIGSVQEAEKEFRQLLRQFPMNKFVLKIYAIFQLEVCVNHQYYYELLEQVKLIESGQNFFANEANLVGLHMFPNLPPRLSPLDHKSQGLSNVNDQQDFDIIDNFNQHIDIDKVNDLKHKIESVKFSGIRFFQISIF